MVDASIAVDQLGTLEIACSGSSRQAAYGCWHCWGQRRVCSEYKGDSGVRLTAGRVGRDEGQVAAPGMAWLFDHKLLRGS